MSEQLKPCPFCGGEASANGHRTYRPHAIDAKWGDDTPITESFFANRMACGATTGRLNIGHRTRGEAIAAWNRRVEL